MRSLLPLVLCLAAAPAAVQAAPSSSPLQGSYTPSAGWDVSYIAWIDIDKSGRISGWSSYYGDLSGSIDDNGVMVIEARYREAYEDGRGLHYRWVTVTLFWGVVASDADGNLVDPSSGFVYFLQA